MTTISTAIRFARLGIAASLLGAGLLIGSVQPSSAGEMTPTPVSAQQQQPQMPSAGHSDHVIAAAPAEPAQATVPLLGAVGFGWG
jgi:hypothetical protein